MFAAGVDVGTKTTKVVLLRDDEVVARGLSRTGFDPVAAARGALEEALLAVGARQDQVFRTVSTGTGRREIVSDAETTDVTAVARGIHRMAPDVKTVIDVGAEEARGIRVGQGGRVLDFVVNEKCAAGTGSFTEAMARAMEVTLDEFGRISLLSERSIAMNAQCAVFAESEVVSLVHSDTPREDIARAVHDAIASRVVSMVRRVGLDERVALVGGMALNVGFCASLSRGTETDLVIPDHPEHVGALGAALLAAQEEVIQDAG